jgi:AcrR family transcriptional regulator
LVRQRQADDTRRRIVEATRRLLQSEGYAAMTIEAIAQRAQVSVPSVYAIFKSKTGILLELLDQSTFGADYDEAVRRALSASDPETRLRLAAPIARQIHDAQSATFDLLRGAGVVAPELAKLEQQREDLRYERQEIMIISLRDAGRIQPELDYGTARDIFWMLTGRDVYRMLVRERGWTSQKYQDWLADTLARSLLTPTRPDPAGSAGVSRAAHYPQAPSKRRKSTSSPKW